MKMIILRVLGGEFLIKMTISLVLHLILVFLVKKGALGGKKGVFGKNLYEKLPILGKHVLYWEKARNRSFSEGFTQFLGGEENLWEKSSWEKSWDRL